MSWKFCNDKVKRNYLDKRKIMRNQKKIGKKTCSKQPVPVKSDSNTLRWQTFTLYLHRITHSGRSPSSTDSPAEHRSATTKDSRSSRLHLARKHPPKGSFTGLALAATSDFNGCNMSWKRVSGSSRRDSSSAERSNERTTVYCCRLIKGIDERLKSSSWSLYSSLSSSLSFAVRHTSPWPSK